MTRYQPDSDYDDEPEFVDDRRSRVRWIVGGVFAAVVVGFGGLMWYAYSLGVQSGRGDTVPVIAAPDGGQLREKPADDGLPPVPNADKPVYSALEPGAEPQTAERLRPPPEALLPPPPPMPAPPQAVAPQVVAPQAGASQAGGSQAGGSQAGGSQAATPPAPAAAASPPAARTVPERSVTERSAPKPAERRPPEAKAPEKKAPEKKAAERKPEARPEAKPEARPEKPAEKQVASLPPAGKGFRVQLGAYGSAKEADDAARRLKSHNADLLGRLSFVTEPVHLSGGRTLYRVQAGTLSDEALAQLLCDQMKSRKTACFVVPR